MGLTVNPLNTAVEGLKKAEQRVDAAVLEIQAATVVAGNAVNGGEAAAVEDAVRGAVIPAEGDIVGPLVDLIQAKTAYMANAFAVKVTADVETDVVRMMNRKV